MADKPVTTLLIGLGGSGAWTAVNVKRQLYDAYDNQMPDNVRIVVLDTAKTDIVGRGAEGVERRPGMGIGQTVLDRDEKAHVGGNVHQWSHEIDSTNRYPHISSWYLSERFLADLPESSFLLDEGAGMYRQFGRLAIFRDVQAPAASSIANIIDNTIVSLNRKRSANDPSMSVVICASLAGGTGAGMFLDIPHLVQRVAAINNITLTIRGFLYLPDAFKGNLSATQLGPAHGRSFAALRELSRFLMNSNYQYGYPMYYHSASAGQNRDLWRASNTGKLYDYVYLVDGKGLNNRKLEEGSASAVADGIVNFIDPNFGPRQNQYDVNIRSRMNDLQDRIGKRPFVSAMGSYSVVMPIQQILEGWAHRLAKQLLDGLVPGIKDERGRIVDLVSTANPAMGATKPIDEVERITKSLTPITDTTVANRQLMPLPLWGKSYDLYAVNESNENTIQRLYRYDLVDWLEWIVPPGTQADPEAKRVRDNAINILQEQIAEFVETSAEREDGDPESDWVDINRRSERFITRQLGQPASGGGRQGGEYASSLQKLIEMNVRRYREYMTLYISQQLNGDANQENMIRAKSGKLGWLVEVFKELRAIFASVYSRLDQVRTGQGVVSPNTARAEAEEYLLNSFDYMQEMKSETGIFGRLSGSKAVKAQEAYIDAVQEYVDYFRKEYARDAVATALTEIIAFSDDILAKFAAWRNTLATDVDSLYETLLAGERHIRADRKIVGDVANHRVIDDEAYENRLYERYVTEEVLQNLFGAWTWQTSLVSEGRSVEFNLGARMVTYDDPDKNVIRGSDKRNWDQSNADLVLSYARRVFRRASQEESLMQYLIDNESPQALADELINNADYMLNYRTSQASQGVTPGYILLGHFNEDRAQIEYVGEINRHLGANNQQGNIDDNDNPNQIVASSADRFRLTYLATAELIPLEEIEAYYSAKEKYLGLPYDTRQKNHIFPAEVHAIEYEKELGNSEFFDSPDSRLLTDRVRLLLEYEERFVDFLYLMIYRLVSIAEVDNNRTIQRYWRLRAPYQDTARSDQFDEWYLTQPEENPSLLDACIMYVINQHDIRNKERVIPESHVIDYLGKKQSHDTAARLKQGKIGHSSKELKGYLQALLPPKNPDGTEDLSNWTEKDDEVYLDVARMLARHDEMTDLLNDFKNHIPDLKQSVDAVRNSGSTTNRHDEEIRQQELYDMFSVALIRLTQETNKLQRQIKRRYEDHKGEHGSIIPRK